MCRCDAFAVWDSGLTGVNVSLCLGYRGVRRGGGVRWGFSGDQRLVWWWSTGWCLAEVCCGCTGGSRTSSLLPFGAYCGLESYRVIVLRGQASLPQVRWWAGIVGAELARDGGAAVWSDTASSFIAGKPSSHRGGWCGSDAASSFFAGEPRSNRFSGGRVYRIIVYRGQARLPQEACRGGLGLADLEERHFLGEAVCQFCQFLACGGHLF